MNKEAKAEENLLSMFLGEFGKFAEQISEAALRQTEDEDEKAVIRAFAPSLVNQVSELSNFIREQAARSTKQQMAEVNQVLKLTSGVTLAQSAQGLLPSIGSVIGKLGIARILEELKKIVRGIFEAFNIKMPKWLELILLIIDELANTILSAGSAKMATTLSIQEQNYLAELTQLAKLQQASQFKYQEDEDDE